jgi:signal transduction histidine kinase
MAVGDPARLRTAISHLLSNAEKFGPPGSTIYITTKIDKGQISVVIGDEGPGIPDEIRDHIFERFYQADASDTRRYGGLGLGLYLTRQVVMAMGGDVIVDRAGKGCSVRITLPAPGTDNDAQLPVRVRVATSGVRRGLGSVDRDP